MIRVVSLDTLAGYSAPGITVRDHFRGTPENHGTPHYMLGPLRVLADTTIEAQCGFPEHPHREMEIVSYVSAGTLSHADTLGRSGRLRPGDMQVMTTGTGLRHSEVNEGDTPARMYQMWILPERSGLTPSYVDVPDPKGGEAGTLHTLVSGLGGRPGAAYINVPAAILGAELGAGQSVVHAIAPGRHTYVLAAAGRIALDDAELGERDGAEIADVAALTIRAITDADVLVLDLP